ncbi:hypothetical protein Vadar_006902 [Vaccinium darrowii]|uniref:Uncharacterized protein n=1 Tax=Vaccinium darrowii TaxID=229202 RepID=A0ACB7YC18_9ERIC|nr:hypothetical protein Vadar_006902 [Vaccinium darrowii]
MGRRCFWVKGNGISRGRLLASSLCFGQDFEDLVREHFRRSIANANSVGFKLMMAKIVPKLFFSLHEVGADCDAFKHLQQL